MQHLTQDEIIDMARQAQQESFVGDSGHWFKMEVKDLVRFAKLVESKEREECAKICDYIYCHSIEDWEGANRCGDEIRARGEA